MAEKGNKLANNQNDGKKTRVSQTDVPVYSLEDALRIPEAILENYAGRPSEPFKVAKAMGMQPGSSRFRVLTGSAIAYGLTEGGYNSDKISVLPLARRMLQSTSYVDEILAKRQSLNNTRVFREFMNHYNGSPLPSKDSIAQDVLKDLGVPEDRTGDILSWIITSAKGVGLIDEIKGKKYVYLDSELSDSFGSRIETDEHDDENSDDLPQITNEDALHAITQHVGQGNDVPFKDDTRKRRVFITHGKNRGFLELIKNLLQFGELEPIVAAERQSVSEPVPDKVMNDMRSCGAAIIHVDAEQRLMDNAGNEQIVLNPNVLIEIGAAMALYGRRFILLVKEGVKLPSNLQGLFEVRYSGDTLDGDTTVRLMKAINEMKKIERIN